VKTLKHGERGAEVKTVQRLLKERGFFNAYVGGNFLERTEAAVKAFQAANKGPDGSDLEVDGIVGKNTWWALESTPAEAAATGSDYLKYGDKGNEVLKLQRLLAKQGFFKDEPSGSFNVVTQDAVTYFQQSHLGSDGSFLDVDGVVGPATWWALRNPSGAPQKSGLHSAAPASLTPLRQRQLEIVLGEHKKGVKEVPDGSNWGTEIPKYGGRKGDPWCCWFWSWGNKQTFGQYTLGAKIGSCMSAWKAAKKKGMAREKGAYVPIPGDAFVMLYRNSSGKLKGTGHIGYVLRVKVQNGRAVAINTVEGNSGNRVKLGKRTLASKDIVGFINPFPADEQPTDWESGIVDAAATEKLGTR